MSTSQKSTSKGPRCSNRRPKPAPSGDEAAFSQTSDFDSSVQPAIHDHKYPGDSPSEKKPRNKKKANHNKKTLVDSGVQDQQPVPNHQPPTGTIPLPNKAKATPIKQQAYAGPTFHHSPAPSALPMPSFYSKSVPNVSTGRPPEAANDSGAPAGPQTGSRGNEQANQAETQGDREPGPLDFMFEVARKHRETPRAESPIARSTNMSVYGGSPYNRSPAPREGDSVFPFELEGGTGSPGAIGASFATPYKDRMDALRSTSSSTGAVSDMSESDARAKSDALKKFMNLTPRSASASSTMSDMNNPFNARAPQTRNLQQPIPQNRHHSGPSTPVSGLQNGPGPNHYFPNMPPVAFNGQNYASPMHRPASSQLRNVYQPSVDASPVELASNGTASSNLISTSWKPSIQHQTPRQANGMYDSAQGAYDPISGHKSKPSAQQMEDELRRVLKLNLTTKG